MNYINSQVKESMKPFMVAILNDGQSSMDNIVGGFGQYFVPIRMELNPTIEELSRYGAEVLALGKDSLVVAKEVNRRGQMVSVGVFCDDFESAKKTAKASLSMVFDVVADNYRLV